ncbi:hypothetical protein [Piscinibacter terrae]|uniref:Uncharacterized protein n=1 Tax=Piscinibacter terrae TaxID=2496871 RepID=A0A3N7HTC0_9BURK|nr:hypothetical protein [Albitalea terrae]RQP24526.1 hypothetical protein DZC73_14675 [Albitalea terrae]
MSQADMAVLFGTTTQNITIRIKTLYAAGVLDPNDTRRRILQSCMEGRREVRRHVYIYNLQVIVAIGRGIRGRLGEVFRRCCHDVNDGADL